MRGPLLLRLALVAVALLPLVGCGAAGSGPAPSRSTDPAPVTIEHAFGSTTVPASPQRVLTWGWGSADAAIALGVVPVAIPTQAYGGDAQGVLPWIRQRLEAEGKPLPTLLPDVQEVPVEAVAAAKPDLILAPYSGITEAEYGLLSKIAPTVAYPDKPWATPWRDTVTIVGRALGRSEQAERLLSDIDTTVSTSAKAHPELTGKSVALVWNTPTELYVYRPADARVAFTTDLGLTSAPSVEALSTGKESFYYTLSKERLADLDSDILVSYADTEAAATAFLSSPEARLMEQVRSGAVASVVGTEQVAAVSPPTALSLTWGLDAYVAELSAAAKAADRSR